eukprot:TRINITY_DN5885_c0_g2_i1.p1 TRINITY_DN5885_c0_g2~~TRINITY_DN5885_c0_g2_i1.p1  ORF type:complete len:263 (-),score=84.79 TRINITY_DN5885_c0_g2_i1:218-1006(-)
MSLLNASRCAAVVRDLESFLKTAPSGLLSVADTDFLRVCIDKAASQTTHVPRPGFRGCLVLEGLDGAGKSTVHQRVADLLKQRGYNVLSIRTPPIELAHLRPIFDNPPVSKEVRQAFYLMGNYLAANTIANTTADLVVVDRWWASTVAYQQVRLADEQNGQIPPQGSSVYSWPSDMFHPQPTLTVLLSVPEAVRLQRMGARADAELTLDEHALQNDRAFRARVLNAYRMIDQIVEIDASGTQDEVVGAVVNKLAQTFSVDLA